MEANPSFSADELLAHQGWVRALARHLLLEPGEADDAVQDTFLAALEHPPRPGKPLGPWLARVLRNRVRKGRRGDARRQQRERRAPPELPDPGALVERVEQQQALVRTVVALEEPHRSTLLLHYFEALPAVEIARRQDVPAATVRQRLRRARERLRDELERRSGGDPEAWRLALLAWIELPVDPLPAAPAPWRLSPRVWLPALASVAAATGLVLVLRGSVPGHEPRDVAQRAAVGPTRAAGDPPRDATAARRPVDGGEARADSARRLATLEVSVVRGDGSPAAGEWVLIESDAPRPPLAEPLRACTDARGVARLDLPAGTIGVGALRRGDDLDEVALAAGETRRVEITLPVGYTIEGRLLDAEGQPIAGGSLWVSEPWSAERGHVLATSAPDGSYRLRDLQPDGMHWFQGFAAGFAPARATYLDAAPGSVVEHDVVLAGPGGAVRGRVLDPDGRPIEGAQVRVGLGGTRETPPRDGRTDGMGEFVLEGLRPGAAPVMARHPGLAPAREDVLVPAGGAENVTLVLGPGAHATGRVTGPDGEPVAGARVGPVGLDAFVAAQVRTDEDGRYALDGLASGPVRLRAEFEDLGAEVDARLAPDVPLAWSPTLRPTPVIAGILRDAGGEPVADRELSLREAGAFERDVEYTVTDEDGRFSFGARRDVDHVLLVQAAELDLPDGRLGRAPDLLRRDGIRPGLEPLEIALEDLEARTGSFRGRILDPDGRPPASAWLEVTDLERDTASVLTLDPVGGFELAVPTTAVQLVVEAEGFPVLDLGRQALVPGATLDLGTRTLFAPSRVEVALVGIEPPGDLRVSWVDAGGLALGRGERSGRLLRSPPLAPGRVAVTVQGTGVISRSLALGVAENAVEHTELGLEPALVRRVELTSPTLDPRPERFRAVARDEAGEERWSLEGTFDALGPLAFDVSVPTGVFALEVRVDTGRAATGELEAGAVDGPLHLRLR